MDALRKDNDSLQWSTDMEPRQFAVMAVTACAANAVGFASNAALFGWSFPTVVCGICALLMALLGLAGRKLLFRRAASLIMVAIVNVFEFPFLYYVYGKSTIVYMVLGIIAIIYFVRKKWRIICAAAVVCIDVLVFFYCYRYPSTLEAVSGVNALGATVISYIIVTVSISVMGILVLSQYEQKNRELMEMSRSLKEMSVLDPLTMIFNRRYLTDYLEELMRSRSDTFAIALLDLDDFKSINDSYGHVFGDTVLQRFAGIAKAAIDGKGIAARFGGEEFMLVFTPQHLGDINDTIDSIRRQFAEFSQSEKGQDFTFSGGVEFFRQEDRVTKLFNSADEKLYQAKRKGKNTVIA